MKITFNIEKKENGYSIKTECIDIPKLDDGSPNVEEYRKVWDIALKAASSMV